MSLKKFFQLQVMSALAVMMVFAVGCGEGEDDADDTLDSDSNNDTASDTTVDSSTDTDTDTGSEQPTDTNSDTGDPTDVPIMTYTFESGLQGWEQVWFEPDTDLEFGEGVVMEQITTDGDPDAGAVSVTFDPLAADYKVQLGVNLEPAVDLTGRTITARVKLVEGFTDDPSTPGGTMMFIKTTNGWIWANGSWYDLNEPGEWKTIAFEVDYPDFENPAVTDTDGTVLYEPDHTQVKQIGIHFSTSGTAADEEAGYVYLPTTVLFDSVSF
ncbi:MAG: hypothetical protein JXX29_12525 [Deltaproteobacteria bacterium]|nr:hypothetical protein [Deltaproteobacteria bacterium]MBN2672500.1 hypothetical protein [Deltaproteobacteria bacterium]